MSTPAQGKTDAFLEAYEKYSDAIFRHCYFRVYDRERGKELMQETFTRTWEEIAEGKDIRNLRAFLYRVANNLIIDHSRKRKEESLEVLQEAGFEPSDGRPDGPARDAEAANVIAALGKIDPKYRDVVVMRYVDGMTPKEIGAVLGESENAVSVRIHRAIGKARDVLQI